MENPIKTSLIFNKTPIHTCGYLPEQQATIKFIPLDQVTNQALFTQLNAAGYRRSGDFIYRPSCIHCKACTPIRIKVSDFKRSKSQKRCWNKNKDIIVTKQKSEFTKEHYALYHHYIHTRHATGGMFPPSKEQFTDFLCEGNKWCSFFEFRLLDNTLVAVSVVDHLTHGIAPIYTFFSPTFSHRSLGSFCILWLIDYSNQHSLDYIYLGYWIKKCDKMSYKCKFCPYELLKDGKWVPSDNALP